MVMRTKERTAVMISVSVHGNWWVAANENKEQVQQMKANWESMKTQT